MNRSLADTRHRDIIECRSDRGIMNERRVLIVRECERIGGIAEIGCVEPVECRLDLARKGLSVEYRIW